MRSEPSSRPPVLVQGRLSPRDSMRAPARPCALTAEQRCMFPWGACTVCVCGVQASTCVLGNVLDCHVDGA